MNLDQWSLNVVIPMNLDQWSLNVVNLMNTDPWSLNVLNPMDPDPKPATWVKIPFKNSRFIKTQAYKGKRPGTQPWSST